MLIGAFGTSLVEDSISYCSAEPVVTPLQRSAFDAVVDRYRSLRVLRTFDDPSILAPV